MRYLRRQIVCERLRLAVSTSYKVVGSAYGSRICSDDVLELLNRSRNDTQEVLCDIPSDLMTPAEIAALPEIAESEITEHEIVNWTKRRRNPAPCFRLNKQTRRIRRSSFLRWIEENSRIRRRG